MSEGYAQIAPDSTGAKIRTVEETEVLQSDGFTREDVETQVVILGNADGALIDKQNPLPIQAPTTEGLLMQILDELRKLNAQFEAHHS